MEGAREEARRFVRRKRRFYTVLVVYLALSVLWFAIDVLTGTDDWWFYWPVLGAGLIVLIIGIAVFGVSGFLRGRLGTSADGQVLETARRTEERRRGPGIDQRLRARRVLRPRGQPSDRSSWRRAMWFPPRHRPSLRRALGHGGCTRPVSCSSRCCGGSSAGQTFIPLRRGKRPRSRCVWWPGRPDRGSSFISCSPVRVCAASGPFSPCGA